MHFGGFIHLHRCGVFEHHCDVLEHHCDVLEHNHAKSFSGKGFFFQFFCLCRERTRNDQGEERETSKRNESLLYLITCLCEPSIVPSISMWLSSDRLVS